MKWFDLNQYDQQLKDNIGSAKYFFFGKCLEKNYWIFSQISFFIWKYNPSG